MNGWQRLWVVVCLILAILIGWYTYLLLPTEAMTTYHHEARISELSGFIKESEGSKFLTDYIASLREIIRKENEDYQKDLSDLSKQRTSYITDAINIWFGFAVGLYVIGWLIGWIYRGFRPKRV